MLLIVAAALLAVAQHPFITYPLSLLAWRAVAGSRSPRPEGETRAPLSILCCCANEEAVIAGKMDNTLAAAAAYGGPVEILFHLDGCTDRTADILRGYGDAVVVLEAQEKCGKSIGMARLAACATGEILAFTDANTALASDALSHTARILTDPEIGGVSARLGTTNAQDSTVAAVSSLYWRFEEMIKRLESETGSMIGADGAFFAIRRELYRPPPPDIIDDLHTSLGVILAGRRLVSAPQVRAFEKTANDEREEFRRKVRIACRAVNALRLLAPQLHRRSPEIVYKLYSHKVLRWIALPLGGAGLAALVGHLWITAGPAYALTPLTPLLAALLLGRLGIRPFGGAYQAFLALAAVTIGVIHSIGGRRYQTWTVAPSGR